MIDWIISSLLLIVGLINFVPVIGMLSAERLSNLYGIEMNESNLLILMRHRALLLGLVGGLIIASVFRPELRISTLIVGLISMLGFVIIDRQEGNRNEKLQRIVIMDWIASVLAVSALILIFIS